MAHGRVQFIAVGTPPDEDGSADLKHVVAAARTIGRHMTEHRLVVDKSTVPVGTADAVREAIGRELAARGASIPFEVVSNPEFLKEGAAVDDFMRPDRVVIGSDDAEATRVMRMLYAPFQRNHERLIVMDVRSAELTKYAANAMLATRISFMNEMANLAERLGADVEQVRRGIGADPRIGFHFLYPGAGYGGSCFPKDVKAVVRTAADAGIDLQLLAAVERVNEAQKRVLVDKIVRRFGENLAGRTLRGLGARVQAQHRRHARSAEPRDRGRAARARRDRARLRPGGDGRPPGARSARSRGSRTRARRSTPWPAPTRSSSSPSGRSSAAPTSTRSVRG